MKEMGPFHIVCTLSKTDLTNSVDPDQMPENGASDQGHHCLPLIQCF